MLSKAERIRYLLEAGLCNGMIAEHVDCREEYVRSVKQRLNPRRREQEAAYQRALRATADKRLVSRSWAIHYHGAREDGQSAEEAERRANRARRTAIAVTCDHGAARAAYHAAKRGTANA